MNWVFDNERPIYLQLVEQLKILIISGKFKAGEKLPSVRDLAFETHVNPNTMQKALNELENSKILYTQRTSGKFVTTDKKLLEKLKNELALKYGKQFFENMNNLGFSYDEAIEYLKKSKGEI